MLLIPQQLARPSSLLLLLFLDLPWAPLNGSLSPYYHISILGMWFSDSWNRAQSFWLSYEYIFVNGAEFRALCQQFFFLFNRSIMFHYF